MEHSTNLKEIFSIQNEIDSSIIKRINKTNETELVAMGYGTVDLISNSISCVG